MKKINKKILKKISWHISDLTKIVTAETEFHVENVAQYSYLLAKLYGFSEKKLKRMKIAAKMHDVGKIFIPNEILKKPGKLTKKEYNIVKKHSEVGKRLLSSFFKKNKLFCMAKRIAAEHHERWDGLGYPKGLKGEEISIEGRITAIADVYDALTNKRPYKKKWDHSEAVKFIKKNSGKMFDPELVKLFVDNNEIFKNTNLSTHRYI